MVPLYMKHMGAEAYGLVGFFAMLQAWFNLMDLGLTPTMARESARFQGGTTDVLTYRQLARSLEGVFTCIALIGGTILFLLATPIAEQWLNASQLPQHEVTIALKLIAIIIALRWMCGLYRGVISGSERLVWLGCFNILIASGRFVLVLPVLIIVGSTPQIFFGFQLLLALVELAVLAWMAYRLLPPIKTGQRVYWQWAPLKPVLKFSLSIAFTSSVWILITQTDKMVLSKILTLADYGYFTIAVLVASGIMMVSAPISSSLMPRMARLQAEGKDEKIISIYRQSTQLVAITAIPASLLIIFFAPEVLWAWTGDESLVERATTTLQLYATGYAFLAVGAFPYYLQYAKGNLRLHLIGNALFLFSLIPSVIWASSRYGITGAGWAWLIANAVYFFLWTPLVHRKFSPGLHMGWLLTDIGKPTLPPLFFAVLASHFFQLSDDRLFLTMELIALGIIFSLTAFFLANRLHPKKRGAQNVR